MSKVQGLDDLIARLEAIGEPHPELRALQIATVQEAQKLVHRRTGHLQRSIVPGAISAKSAKVEARTPYAGFVERGTKAHKITAKNAKALAWGGSRRLTGTLRSGSAPTHFAVSVNHPGTKAQPYLLPGARKAVGRLKDVIVRLWNDAT